MRESAMEESSDASRLKERLEIVLEATEAALWEWKVPTGEMVVDDRWPNMLGYARADLHPWSMDTWRELVHPEDLDEAIGRLMEYLWGKADVLVMDLRLRHRSGEWVWVRNRGRAVERDWKGAPVVLCIAQLDLTEARAAEERIREISIHDHLTGLFNRRHLFEELKLLVDRCRRGSQEISVAILDLDHFKSVNDRYGHLAGDEVLRGVADTLRTNLRPYDLAGRYGGEEFIVICQDTGRSLAGQVLERSLGAIRLRRWRFGEEEVGVTFSCGIAESGELETESLTPEGIIERADNRMYQAKAAGRDRIITGLGGEEEGER